MIYWAQAADSRLGGQGDLGIFLGPPLAVVAKPHLTPAGWSCWVWVGILGQTQICNQTPSRAGFSETEGGTSDTQMVVLVSIPR